MVSSYFAKNSKTDPAMVTQVADVMVRTDLLREKPEKPLKTHAELMKGI